MRILRILQIAALVLVLIYGVMVHNANPDPLALPWLVPLAPALVVLLVAVIAFLVGWLPPTLRAWRRSRELARLEQRVAELEQHVPNYDLRPAAPVIPDRTAVADPLDEPAEEASP